MALTQSDKKFILETVKEVVKENNQVQRKERLEDIKSAISENNKTLLKQVNEIIDVKISINNKTLIAGISELIDLKVDTRFNELKDLISHLPQRDEWYDKMDQLLGRQKRQEQDIDLVQTRVSDHEDRISALEAS